MTLRVEVAGGGPVGLAYACTLVAAMGPDVHIRVHDRRWMTRDGRVVWRGQAEGNNRRQQVVTLQSNVWSGLPELVRQRLFTPGNYSEMWPLGPDSPAAKGRPRNIKIRWIEDALLDLAQDVYGIELVPAAFEQPESWDGIGVLAEEASEIVALGAHGPVPCVGALGCTVRPDGNRFVCDDHRTVFKPSVDALSFLWPRILDGVKFFGVTAADITGITSFRLGMQQNSRFTAQIAPGTHAFLLGDAANSLHFWPGRGLNTGLKGALSLAGAVQKRWPGKAFRAADFAGHEGVMQQLQYREKSRAWTTMLMPDADGTPRRIEDRIRAGLTAACSRDELVAELWGRLKKIKASLAGRMGALPSDEWYLASVRAMDTRTLKVMVESGAWITRAVGGDEVAVAPVEARTMLARVRRPAAV